MPPWRWPLIPYFEIPVVHIPVGQWLPFLPWKDLPLHGFGILVAIGFLIGGQRAMKRTARVGMDAEAMNRLVGWLVIGTFVGGHVGYGLIYEPMNYLSDPKQFLYMWSGLSSFGGFFVCVPLAIWFFWREKMNMWAALDSLAHGMAIGWFFGRMGCFLAHDHPGSPTTLPIGVLCRPVEGRTIDLPRFLQDWETSDLRFGSCAFEGGRPVTSILETVPLDYSGVIANHDTGLYEAIWSLAMFGIFLWLDKKPRFPGFYVLLLGLSYAPARFFLDFLRPESTDPDWVFSMTHAQWFCFPLLVVCAGLLYYQWNKNQTPIWNPPGFKPEPKVPVKKA